MKITIITPTFNSDKNIYKNISSVSQQTYKNWEQIIIDNNSTDNTLPIINKFNEKKIKIIKEKDEGIFDAINKGIINSSGEIISILHFQFLVITPRNFFDRFASFFSTLCF